MSMPRRTSNTMIVVAIAIVIAIAAIAVIFWRSHQVVNRVEKALTGADAAKVAVMEAATVHGGLVHIKSDELGYNPASSANPYLANIAIVDGGSITVTTKDTGAQPDLKLLLTPRQDDKNGNAPIRWDCSVVIGDPDEAPLYCRHAPAAPATSSSPANAATVSTP